MRLNIAPIQVNTSLRDLAYDAIKKAITEVTDQTARDNALSVAARQGSVEAVSLLLDAGAQIEVADAQGRTPLMAAVQARKADVLKMGAYKSAVEPFITDKMSPENREQVTALLDDNYENEIKGRQRLFPSETVLAGARVPRA